MRVSSLVNVALEGSTFAFNDSNVVEENFSFSGTNALALEVAPFDLELAAKLRTLS